VVGVGTEKTTNTLQFFRPPDQRLKRSTFKGNAVLHAATIRTARSSTGWLQTVASWSRACSSRELRVRLVELASRGTYSDLGIG
jgi:hypothetical protein